MGALMAALVAALLIRATDKSVRLVAAAAERTGKSAAVILATLIALLITLGVAATAGFFIAPRIAPNAALLMFALSLIAAATGAISPGKAKPISDRGHSFFGVLAALIASGLGGRTEFVVFTIAAGGNAVLAGIGGLIGSMVILIAAAVAGENLWRSLPHRPIGIVIGAVLLIAGAWMALSALGLI